jgi:hypothetical protein
MHYLESNIRVKNLDLERQQDPSASVTKADLEERKKSNQVGVSIDEVEVMVM